MKNLKHYRLMIAGLAVFALAIYGWSPAPVQGDSGKDVVVVNTSTNPVPIQDVDNPERLPFQNTTHGDFVPAGSANTSWGIGLPAGKLIVIEHVSARFDVPLGQQVRGEVACGGASFPQAMHQLIFVSHGTFEGRSVFVASQPLRCFAAGENGLVVFLRRNSTTDSTGEVNIAVSGHALTP